MEVRDLGSRPIAAKTVDATEEKIIEIQTTLAANTCEPSQIKVRSVHDDGQTTMIVNGTNFSEENVEAAWAAVDAMHATPEGQAFLDLMVAFQGMSKEDRKPAPVKPEAVEPAGE
jgi:hypothetical protein